MPRRLIVYGLGLWLAGTLAVRLAGPYLLRPGATLRTVALFAVSFPAAGWIVRAASRRCGLPRDQWPAGAAFLLLPTLLLDAGSSVFFAHVFPEVAPEMAGVFGGWILWCCGAGLLGALPPRRGPAP